MSKRKDFGEVRPKDYWPTADPDAVKPLVPFVRDKTFVEPCCGEGHLIRLLEAHGAECLWASDIEPNSSGVPDAIMDAATLWGDYTEGADLIITNPPFTWKLLQPLLEHLPMLKPTWLLLPADVMHNKRMSNYLRYCSKIVSVGRLYWMDNKIKGVDNYAWFLFDCMNLQTTVFYGRT